MTNPSTTPRLVPDRPSDADKLVALEANLAERYRLCEDTVTPSSILLAVLNAVADVNRIDAAAPPAEAPEIFSERHGVDLRSIKVGEVLAQAQWDAVCAFVREQDAIIESAKAEAPAERGERTRQINYRLWMETGGESGSEPTADWHAGYAAGRAATPAAPAPLPGSLVYDDQCTGGYARYVEHAAPAEGAKLSALYEAASKGFHVSETCGSDGKYLHVSKFQNMADLHAYEDAWRHAMIAARDTPPAAPAEGRDKRGGWLYLDRDEAGVVVDALIEHKDSATRRKGANPASNSDARAELCDAIIGRINAAAASTAPRVTGGRECVHEWVMDSEAPSYSCCQRCGEVKRAP